MFRPAFLRTALFAVAALLAACGGGGGGGDASTPAPTPTPTVQATPEGVFTGTIQGSANATVFDLLTLDTGQFWTLYGNTDPSTGTFLVSGFLEGRGTASGSSFTSGDLRDFGTVPAAAGTLSATFTASTIAGSATGAAGTATFSGARPQQTTYDYDTPANMAAISGQWSAVSVGGGATSLAVSPSGSFTGAQGSCTFSGALTPHGQKNVFDVAFTFGGAPCALPGQTVTGIALDFPAAAGQQLVVALVDATRSRGAVVLGLR